MKRFLLSLLFALAFAAPAAAQGIPGSAIVVNNCGTPPATYTAGQNQPVLQDTTGKGCVNASVPAIAVAPLTSTNLTSTVSVTNTFQSIQVLTTGRKGCLIQNTYTNSNPMWVFFGPIGSATKGASFELDPSHGLSISCAVGGLGVLSDQVSITGTSADSYTANFQ